MEGLFQIRTVEDCDRIRAAARAGARVVVVGLGFIGSEVAASLRQLGLEVAAIEGHPVPLARVLGEEVGKVLADILGTRLIRLQCYEGIDVNNAVYEWAYAKQMLHIRLLESSGAQRAETEREIYSPQFLVKRPLLQAIESDGTTAPVLLIDEIDRAVEPLLPQGHRRGGPRQGGADDDDALSVHLLLPLRRRIDPGGRLTSPSRRAR